MTDVLVVGGGVAGSATAIHLARRGRAVCLVDRATFPRRKACGEGLFPAGVRELRELGVSSSIREAPTLESLRFVAFGESAEAALGSRGDPALGLRRDLLDAALLEAAKRSGVEVRCGARAAELAGRAGGGFAAKVDGDVLDAGAIVAADGLNSGLRRQAGLEPQGRGDRFGVSAHLELSEPPAPRVEVFFRRGFEVYVTPVGGRVVNVAVLMRRRLARELAGDAGGFIETLLLRERCLPAGWRREDEALVAGPFHVRPRRLWSENLVLAGDAAGFFDGITGEGMSLALVSARHCAEAVDAFLASGSSAALEEYERRRRKLARNSEALGRLTLALASREWVGRRAVRALSRRASTFTMLVAISSGDERPGSLRPWEALRLLAACL